MNNLLVDLKKHFKNRNCFLMPHPGAAVFKKDFDGNPASKLFNVHEFERRFSNLTSNYIKSSRADLFRKIQAVFQNNIR